DNPFIKTPNALKTIWSYGHRNPQGLALNSLTGEIWSSEHGPRGGDEINRIEAGSNYGWPLRSQGIHYDGTPFPWNETAAALVDPVYYWTPSIGVAGTEFYTGDAFALWQGNLLVGSLGKQELHR